MITSTRTPTVLATVALLALGACAEEETPAPANTPVEQGLQQVLAGSVAKPDVKLPGAIAHYRHPAYRRWSGAAGLGEIPAAVAMRPHDRFRAGSVLKTLIATVVLQHVESGKLSLEQRLPELLPGSVTARIAGADQITLRMLLGHTSGIPEWVGPEVHAQVAANTARIWTAEEELEIASRLPAAFAPGTSWGYSNTNYTLVGLVLDRVGGKSWRAQVRERVLDRLDLRNSALPEPGDTSMGGEHAHGYQDVGGGATLDLTAVDPSMAGAAGGHALVTTAQDLGRFLDALLAGELFANPATLATMKTMVEATSEAMLPYRYGLGLEEYTMPNGLTVIGHAGSTAGYAVMMFHHPASQSTLVTAVNTSDLFVNALQVFVPGLEVIAASSR